MLRDSLLKFDKLIITEAFNEAFLFDGIRRSESLLSILLDSSASPNMSFFPLLSKIFLATPLVFASSIVDQLI